MKYCKSRLWEKQFNPRWVDENTPLIILIWQREKSWPSRSRLGEVHSLGGICLGKSKELRIMWPALFPSIYGGFWEQVRVSSHFSPPSQRKYLRWVLIKTRGRCHWYFQYSLPGNWVRIQWEGNYIFLWDNGTLVGTEQHPEGGSTGFQIPGCSFSTIHFFTNVLPSPLPLGCFFFVCLLFVAAVDSCSNQMSLWQSSMPAHIGILSGVKESQQAPSPKGVTSGVLLSLA